VCPPLFAQLECDQGRIYGAPCSGVITPPRKARCRWWRAVEIHKQRGAKGPVPARAQEVEVGTNLICDTQEQVERFVALRCQCRGAQPDCLRHAPARWQLKNNEDGAAMEFLVHILQMFNPRVGILDIEMIGSIMTPPDCLSPLLS
jgi:hypothetical protein